jgi:serine/threonine protein kinase
MVMSLHGENLFNLFEKCNRRFDSHTIYLVARAMLKDIEYLHGLGFVHKDVKPQNFVVGGYGFVGDSVGKEDDEIYLVDFGLARRFGQMEHRAM